MHNQEQYSDVYQRPTGLAAAMNGHGQAEFIHVCL